MTDLSGSEVAIISSAGVFFMSQVFNLMSLRWRVIGSTVAIAMAALILLLAPEAWEGGVFGWFLAIAALIGKWGNEVNTDIEERKDEGKRLLANDLWGLNTFLNPAFILLYRRRMFRNKRSKKDLLADSWELPKLLR